MRVGLFIPCFIDQLYPDVGLATVEVLERCGVEIGFPEQQTCCGQPLANSGFPEQARPLAQRFLEIFDGYSHIVTPSGSCAAMVRHHYGDYLAGEPGYEELRQKTLELSEFLIDVLQITSWQGDFRHRVGLHQSCHGLRELRLGPSSERVESAPGKTRQLLDLLGGIEFGELQRVDECCGFGGTFAVNESDVSCAMGADRVADHERAGVEVIAAADMSCLMHLQGVIRRRRKSLHVMHIAQILAGRPVPQSGEAAS
ncbi:MAG: (Fe-S)-binding protein [Pirellulaceae bacterium]|jgi:L-lactate dehydrogenase complex protein LldE|nr:(Fe-S)-binding protein [Pirellulaceae bacterium]MDP7016123.1 (Fe-S)-binding protein [Pirellulaceae bacterium]